MPRVSVSRFLTTRDFVVFLFLDTFRIQRILLFSLFLDTFGLLLDQSRRLFGGPRECVTFFNHKGFIPFPYSKDFAVFPVSRHSKAISGWMDGLDPTIIICTTLLSY